MGLNVVKKVRICEVGLRDGLQNEKTILTTEQKVGLVNQMTDAGFKVIRTEVTVKERLDTYSVYARLNSRQPL